MPNFKVVDETAVDQTQGPSQKATDAEIERAKQMMAIALKTLSQKAVVALATIFTGAGLLSAWMLWRSVLPNPSVNQLIGVTIYGVFLLILEYVRRK